MQVRGWPGWDNGPPHDRARTFAGSYVELSDGSRAYALRSEARHTRHWTREIAAEICTAGTRRSERSRATAFKKRSSGAPVSKGTARVLATRERHAAQGGDPAPPVWHQQTLRARASEGAAGEAFEPVPLLSLSAAGRREEDIVKGLI